MVDVWAVMARLFTYKRECMVISSLQMWPSSTSKEKTEVHSEKLRDCFRN